MLIWLHRIRFLVYVLMLLWLIQLVRGEKSILFFIIVGYPIALFYEIMARKYAKFVTKHDNLNKDPKN